MSLTRRLVALEARTRTRTVPALTPDRDHPIFARLAADGLIVWLDDAGWSPVAPIVEIERAYVALIEAETP